MDFRHGIPGGSPSSSSSTSSSSHTNHPTTNGITNNNNHPPTNSNNNNNNDPMQSWWESISKARSRIQLLSTLLPDPNSNSISSLADSDSPARALLSSLTAYSAVSSSLSTSPISGSGDDSLCNWLYDTFLSSDPDLRLVVLSFIPLVSGLYLSRVHSRADALTSLAGFEAVLLAVYASECRSRAGKAVVINIPDLSQPSLYHSPRVSNSNGNSGNNNNKKKVSGGGGGSGKVGGSEGVRQSVGVLSMPLEPQTAIKSTKRATIVGVALDCYYKHISQMPTWSKVDFCRFAVDWAGQDCVCKSEFDERVEVVSFSFSDDDGIEVEGNVNVVEEMKNLEIEVGNSDNSSNVVRGTRIMLPWELLQPILRILGHCLLGPLNTNDVKDAALLAVRCLYARGSHDLVPQAILATRSLIQLDKRAREAAAMAAASAANTAGSNANTPSKAKKPEILLVSK